MIRYSIDIIQKARDLREKGKTYGEIRLLLGRQIPKSTLAEWCKKTLLPASYRERIAKLNLVNLQKGRSIALEINKIKREEFLQSIRTTNLPLALKVDEVEIGKIALAMLCLGEASRTRGSFCLGSSDPRIVIILLELLKKCFPFNIERIRCTVQCRADQDVIALKRFWVGVTKIPKRLFYKTQIDPRTKNKPTKNKNYKGVLRIDYFDTKVQIELEILSDLVYNHLEEKRARSLKG